MMGLIHWLQKAKGLKPAPITNITSHQQGGTANEKKDCERHMWAIMGPVEFVSYFHLRQKQFCWGSTSSDFHNALFSCQCVLSAQARTQTRLLRQEYGLINSWSCLLMFGKERFPKQHDMLEVKNCLHACYMSDLPMTKAFTYSAPGSTNEETTVAIDPSPQGTVDHVSSLLWLQ